MVRKDGTMKNIKLSCLVIVYLCALLINGCVPPTEKDLMIKNRTQRQRIAELESQLQADNLKLDQLKRKLDTADTKDSVQINALNLRLAALEEDIASKKALIISMQNQILTGGMALPVELVTMLEDFAKDKKMVTYDASRGVVKFKSDLLFKSGSDKVVAKAVKTVVALCNILNSEQGKKFDIVIAGHTDDMRIARPATRAKHPTNWHLSSHRAISVLNIMLKNNMTPQRLSVRGFGEFRPIEKNKPGKKGNPKNRRVEIYIIAKGT